MDWYAILMIIIVIYFLDKIERIEKSISFLEDREESWQL